MMHPDQIYTVRQLQHQDLRMEAKQARAQRKLSGNRTPWGSTEFATWLREWSARRFGGVTLSSRSGWSNCASALVSNLFLGGYPGLMEVKNHDDQTYLFHVNQNNKPALEQMSAKRE